MANEGRDIFNKVRHGHWTPFLWLTQQQEPTGTPEEQLLRLVEERAVTEVLTEYAYYYDASDVDRVMTLFTDDAVVVSARGLYAGKSEVDANYRWVNAQRLRSYHRVTNVMVRFSPGSQEAWATAYFNAIGQNHDELRRGNAGNYFARLLKQDGRWLLADFRMIVDLAVGFGPGPGAPTGGSAPTPTVQEDPKAQQPIPVEQLPSLW